MLKMVFELLSPSGVVRYTSFDYLAGIRLVFLLL